MEIKELNEVITKELVKNGYARDNGKRVWNVAQRKFLYLTPKLADGFLALRKFGRYKRNIAQREAALLKNRVAGLLEGVDQSSFNLIDVCCGDGTKVIELLKEFKRDARVRYCPLNVSDYLVNKALHNVKKAGFLNVIDYEPLVHDWDGRAIGKIANKVKDQKFKKNVILLLGSVLASFDINDYLFELSRQMSKGDILIIGNGIRMGERLVRLSSYKHKIFDRWFTPLLESLGLSRKDVIYDTRFGNKRVEMFYKTKKEIKIQTPHKPIVFRKGDELLVAFLYKYYETELKKFCKMYFSKVDVIKDKEDEYVVAICRK